MIVAALFTPENVRIALPVVLAVGYACYHWWYWRTLHPKVRADAQPKPMEPKVEPSPKPERASEVVSIEPSAAICADVPQAGAESVAQKQAPSAPIVGEEAFLRARAMRHQEIPDYQIDGLYLDLLGDSAEKGYAPAMAKLGEYAMRRETWVEAYYWMSRAKRRGMPRLDAVLRDIRRNWMLDDAPEEEENVYELFSEEAGSIGRALLDIDTGRDVYAAKEYLKSRHPEFLDA